jgi:hypothetical protein
MDDQLIEFVRSDGTEIKLHTPPSRAVASMSGWGSPPHTIHTESGPYQHGEDVISYRLAPRIVTLTLHYLGTSRTDWFNQRTRLLSLLGLNASEPNDPSVGTLRWRYLQNNQYIVRCLDGYITRGPDFVPQAGWREWGLSDELEFTAHNPIIYDPTETFSGFTFTAGLIFPITFPIILGIATGTQTIAYAGTWEEYPTIEIIGPTAGFFIQNITTDKIIRSDYTVSAGETVTITLTYGQKSVVNNYGVNLIDIINKDSNFAEFALLNAPRVSGGSNLLQAGVFGHTASTRIYIYRKNRYYGI